MIILRKIRKLLPWKYLGQGNYRKTYLLPSGKYVIKIPINDDGQYNNWGEVKEYKEDKSGLLARCRLFKYRNQLCCIMEKLTIPKDLHNLPDWCSGIDCQQVGYTRKGKLVAYDWYYV